MKIRVSLLAVLLLASLSGLNALQGETQDFFLLPPCGGGAKSSPVRVNMQTLQRHRISGSLPGYPEAAKKEQLRGVVAMDVQVDTEGSVSQVKVFAGNPVLAKAAVRAIKKWKYRPVTVQGEAFVVNGDVVLTFNPTRNPPVQESGKWPFHAVGCVGLDGPLLHMVAPEYPKMARLAHVTGDVVLDVMIDKEGKIEEAKVISGHPLLIDSAVDAVKQWRYKPYVVGGGHIAVETLITVKFHM